MRKGVNGKAVLKLNKATMEVLGRYASANDAALGNGLEPNSVARQAKRMYVPAGMHVYRYEKDYDPNESFEGRKNRPVLAEDVVTGKRVVFCDAAAMARAVHVSYGTVLRCLSKGLLLSNQLRLSYYR